MDVDNPSPAGSPAVFQQVSGNAVATNQAIGSRAPNPDRDVSNDGRDGGVGSKMDLDNPKTVTTNHAVCSPALDHNVSAARKDSHKPETDGGGASVGRPSTGATEATILVASNVDVELPAFMPDTVAKYLRAASLSMKWHDLLKEYFCFESENPPLGVCFFLFHCVLEVITIFCRNYQLILVLEKLHIG